jgi:3-hydroxyisobutyrate dehydrogenase-like beta-hydroxyacid dehydrogenase
MKVGFIGLGSMGAPMARRVLKAGFVVYTTVHRRREAAEQLASLGAAIVDDPASVARAADVIITILPADNELKETILGPAGVINGFAPGKILIDMTTGTSFGLQEVEKVLVSAGGRVLDAPVSGGTTGAEQGTLTIMVGGDAALLEECRPLLETMGKRIIHVGGVGQGKVVKMVNQMMAAANLLAIGEAFALGVRCGASPATLFEVIKESSGYSKMMDLRLPGYLLDGVFEPGFRLDLMKKDVNLAIDSARAGGVPLFVTAAVAQVFAAASAAGKGNADFSAAAQFLADLAKVKLAPPRPGSAAGTASTR